MIRFACLHHFEVNKRCNMKATCTLVVEPKDTENSIEVFGEQQSCRKLQSVSYGFFFQSSGYFLQRWSHVVNIL